MILMIGLPASGKTTWAKKHIEEHPEKRYYLIGTSALLEKMKVDTIQFLSKTHCSSILEHELVQGRLHRKPTVKRLVLLLG